MKRKHIRYYETDSGTHVFQYMDGKMYPHLVESKKSKEDAIRQLSDLRGLLSYLLQKSSKYNASQDWKQPGQQDKV